jgi:NAD(P) transhydrogenase
MLLLVGAMKNSGESQIMSGSLSDIDEGFVLVETVQYDMVVLGCGPAGQRAAIAASKLGKKTAIIEPHLMGGNCTHFGTLPSKTFREAALHLTNHRLRYYDTQTKKAPTMAELVRRVEWVMGNEVSTIVGNLISNGIDTIGGYGRYKDKKTIEVLDESRNVVQLIKFQRSVICCGSKPFLPEGIPFDGEKVFSSDNILKMKELPHSITIIGGGIIGCEYASIFSILGVRVNLVEKRSEILALVDRDMRANLVHQLDMRKTRCFLGDELQGVELTKDDKVEVSLASGKKIKSEAVLVCVFRVVNTTALNLDKIGVKTTPRGVLDVNEDLQTTVPGIFAAGDVIGAPSLASTSFEQGRIAGMRAFKQKCAPMSPNVPIGVYTIPEISYVGKTEKELTEAKIPYQVGQAYFKDTSRGAIMGALDGMLKIMFHQETKKMLAVHVVGEGATELVHVGQAVIELGGTVDYFMDKVFNFPTLAETYKFAAYNGLNRMRDI